MQPEDDFKLVKVLSVLSKRLRRFYDRNVAGIGLTGPQGHILCFIAVVSQWRPIYQHDIESEFGIRRSTATGALKLLERDGLIERRQDTDDARRKRLELTAKARTIQRHLVESALELNRRLRTGLSDEELAGYIAVTERISGLLEEPAAAKTEHGN